MTDNDPTEVFPAQTGGVNNFYDYSSDTGGEGDNPYPPGTRRYELYAAITQSHYDDEDSDSIERALGDLAAMVLTEGGMVEELQAQASVLDSDLVLSLEQTALAKKESARLQRDVDMARSKAHEYEAEIDRLQQENAQLRSSTATQRLNNELERDRLDQDRHALDKERKTSRIVKLSLCGLCVVLAGALGKFSYDLHQLKQENSSATHTQQEFETHIANLKNQLEEQKAANAQLSSKSHDSESTASDLQRQVDEQKKNVEQAVEMLKQRDDEIADLKDTIDELSRQPEVTKTVVSQTTLPATTVTVTQTNTSTVVQTATAEAE